jgi:hypothetical protein
MVRTNSLLLGVTFLLVGGHALAERAAHCRYDDTLKKPVAKALDWVMVEFQKEGFRLPFRTYVVNPRGSIGPKQLAVKIIKDAVPSATDKQGCLRDFSLRGQIVKVDGFCVPGQLTKCTKAEIHTIESRRHRTRLFEPFSNEGACYLTNLTACEGDELSLLRRAGGERDKFSVLSVCEVSKNRGWTLICSAGAMKSLLARNNKALTVTAPLLFVLAHELYHIGAGIDSSFFTTDFLVDLEWANDKKLGVIEKKCRMRTAMRDPEERADAAATRVLQNRWQELLVERYDGTAVVDRLIPIDDIAYAISRLNAWSAFWSDNTLLHSAFRLAGKELISGESMKNDGLGMLADLIGNRAYLDSTDMSRDEARRFVAYVTENRTGKLAVPIRYGGTHPQGWERLAALMQRVEDFFHYFYFTGLSNSKMIPETQLDEAMSRTQLKAYVIFIEYLSGLDDSICEIVQDSRRRAAWSGGIPYGVFHWPTAILDSLNGCNNHVDLTNFSLLRVKTDLEASNEFTVEMLRDDSKPSIPEKVQLMSYVEAGEKRTKCKIKVWSENELPEIAQLLEFALFQSQTQFAELYNGLLTWGEFNSKRSRLFLAHQIRYEYVIDSIKADDGRKSRKLRRDAYIDASLEEEALKASLIELRSRDQNHFMCEDKFGSTYCHEYSNYGYD